MPYSKTTWVTGTTPISAANMNNLETQYDEAMADGADYAEGEQSDISESSAGISTDGGSWRTLLSLTSDEYYLIAGFIQSMDTTIGNFGITIDGGTRKTYTGHTINVGGGVTTKCLHLPTVHGASSIVIEVDQNGSSGQSIYYEFIYKTM